MGPMLFDCLLAARSRKTAVSLAGATGAGDLSALDCQHRRQCALCRAILSSSNCGEDGMPEMRGGCLCGQIRYSANAEPVLLAVCHCKNCQKQAGTAFS